MFALNTLDSVGITPAVQLNVSCLAWWRKELPDRLFRGAKVAKVNGWFGQSDTRFGNAYTWNELTFPTREDR